MKFYTLDEVRTILRPMNLQAIYKDIGVHQQTLYNFMASKNKSVNFDTYRKIVEYLERRNGSNNDNTKG